MALIDPQKVADITGLPNDASLQFYIDATIKYIERILGYSLSETTRIDYIPGLNTSYVWLIRKPLTEVISVTLREKIIDTENYSIRNKEYNPHIILKKDYVCDYEEIEIENTAGYKNYDSVDDPKMPEDIQMFIISTITDFISVIENGDLKSYKIDTISYNYTDFMNKSQKFNAQIQNYFGILL